MSFRSARPLTADSVALVTGASSGLGAEFARALARTDIGRIVLVARRQDRLESLQAEIGPRAVAHPTDLTDAASLERLFAAEPRVDLLINNAGFGLTRPFGSDEDSTDRLLEMVDLNCRAVVHLCSHYLPAMKARRSGWVLNVGSIAGMIPIPSMVVYAATKAFVHSFTEGLRVELRGSGIRVHLLAPGPVDTEFYQVSYPGKPRPPGSVFIAPDKVAARALDDLVNDRPFRVPRVPLRIGMVVATGIPRPIWRPLARLGSSAARRWMNHPTQRA